LFLSSKNPYYKNYSRLIFFYLITDQTSPSWYLREVTRYVFLQSAYRVTVSANSKVQRLVQYWAIATALFVLSAGILWFEVEQGMVPVVQASWLSIYLLGGTVVFYGLIRTSAATGITPSQLAFGQGMHAITSITAGYMVVTPVRGAVLTLLLVVLVFCAFALESFRSHQINAFAVVLLGAAMWCGAQH
jgi:hypothetical protein